MSVSTYLDVYIYTSRYVRLRTKGSLARECMLVSAPRQSRASPVLPEASDRPRRSAAGKDPSGAWCSADGAAQWRVCLSVWRGWIRISTIIGCRWSLESVFPPSILSRWHSAGSVPATRGCPVRLPFGYVSFAWAAVSPFELWSAQSPASPFAACQCQRAQAASAASVLVVRPLCSRAFSRIPHPHGANGICE